MVGTEIFMTISSSLANQVDEENEEDEEEDEEEVMAVLVVVVVGMEIFMSISISDE